MMAEKTLSDVKSLSNQSPGFDYATTVQNCIALCSEVKLEIHIIVEALESSLNHQNASERVLGTGFLADVLHGLPKTSLNENQLKFLSTFFVDRLKDHHSVIPKVINAFLALVKYENLNNEDLKLCLQGLFMNVQCQSQVMSDRRNIYNLFKYCVVHKLQALKEMGQDFTYGMLTSMDGEKDPRNLVLLFSIFPTVVANINLGPFTEEMFEVVAAYFPIDFVPPSDDPYGLSAEDLILGLRDCLSSCPDFGPFCLPLLQEKLDSDITAAKIDALHTLVKCCETYKTVDIHTHALPLWTSLRREVIENLNPEVSEAALSALTALLEVLERGPTSDLIKATCDQITQSALRECLGHLATPEHRLMYPSSQLLLAICASSPRPAAVIASKVIPLLHDQYKHKKEENPGKNILLILSKFIKCCGKYDNLIKDGGVIFDQRKVWWSTLLVGLVEENSVILESAIVAITSVTHLLSKSQLGALAGCLCTLLLHSKHTIRDAAAICTVAVGSQDADPIHCVILPYVIPRLADIAVNGSTNSTDLEVLSSINVNVDVTSQIIVSLWQKTVCSALNEHKLLSLKCIQCIDKLLYKSETSSKLDNFILKDWVAIEEIVQLMLKCIYSYTHKNELFTMLESLSSLCRTIISHLREVPWDLISSLIDLTVKLITNWSVSCISTDYYTSIHKDFVTVEEFLKFSEYHRFYLVYILEGLILCIPVKHLDSYIKEIVTALSDWTTNMMCDERLVQSISIVIATIVNKLPDGDVLLETIEILEAKVWPYVKDCPGSIYNWKNAMTLLSWVAKALVIRHSDQEQRFIALLYDALSEEHIGEEAAMSFPFIMKDHEYALTKNTGANIRIFYRQRFFKNNLGQLLNKYNNDENSDTSLLAITSMFSYLPSQVLQSEFINLLPTFTKALQSTNDAVLEEAVNTLSVILKDNVYNKELQPNLFITNLLGHTTGTPLKVRLKSCECLGYMSKMEVTVILPYRQEVLNGLKVALNDRKRIVRTAAGKARSMWVLVGAP